MRSQIKLGTIFGIRIGLHYSWFLIALLIVFSLSDNFHASYPKWPESLALLLGIVTALLFFVSLLLHELAHSLIAERNGMPVREITLFALGGVSQLEADAPNAKVEFWMALAGPLTSVLIGLACLGMAEVARSAGITPALAVLVWLGYINISLAVFNMIPGYPLDGGRVLRALVWWRTGDMERATRMSARVGQGVAGIFIVIGIVHFFAGGGLGGLWIAFIGWFLLGAAKESAVEVGLKKSLAGVRVGDVMARNCPTVDGHSSVQDFVDHELLRTGRRCFVVVEDGRVAGLITPHEIKEIDRETWSVTALDKVMRPLGSLRTLPPDASLMSALEAMGREDLNQLPVVSNGRLEGVLSRAEILAFLQTRAEF
ncbi:MAG: site-2 protease family protein [Acidobacteriaceae bacterium]